MLSWNEYIEELLSTPTVLDNMFLQYGDNAIAVSPIVKASIQMLESMIETEGRHNVFVFPEIKELLYEFVLSKIVFNVAAGKINITYDPHTFKPGQKLKYKNCVVEFDRYAENDYQGKDRVYIRFADGASYGVPAEIAPIFQIADADTKRFSKSKAFYDVYSAKKAIEELRSSPEKRDIIEALTDYKTHLDGSIFLITSIKNAKEYFDQTFINGTPLKDVLLIGKVQTDGTIDSCYPGQLSGNPAIVLASDLYSVIRAVEQGAKVQSIIINSSQNTLIDNQLDTLDDLSREEFPILCLTDTSNSFELDVLLDRGYNVWRWDANSLVETVHASDQKTAGHRIQNCAKQNVAYERVNCVEITDALQLIYSHKAEIESQGTDVISAYNKLFSLLFTSLRIAVPFEREEIGRVQGILEECKVALEHEKRFMSQELYRDLLKAIANFEKVFVISFDNPKVSKIAEIISSKKYSSVCIVITDRLDKMRCEEYWRNFAVRKHSPTVVKVLYPQEYASSDTVRYDATIIVGWLNNKNMRNVIYCYGTQEYIVLTYECEEKWRKAHTRTWSRSLSNSSNNRIVKNSFSRKARATISDRRFTDEPMISHEDTFDELTDIENLIQINTYRQYGVSANGQNQIVEAYPVNFVGGYLAFYRTGHKVITVTDIIVDGKDNVSLKTPDLLRNGDFVAVREAQRDIIRDIADKILENSGKPHAREIALRWREALSVETMFSTMDEIYHNLQSHGCTRGYQTVKNWIEDEDQFSLSSKDDLVCIAKALNDDMLFESIDDVYMAGIDVKRAHVKAGQYLSQKLRAQVADRIAEFGEIDAFNILDPIELQLEDIGKVIILKIIDINRPIQIDSGNTNRLLSE
jgi:hypothetical protein